jgi:hypothetical protein
MTEASVGFAGNLTDDPELRHTEGTQPHHRGETFSTPSGPALRPGNDTTVTGNWPQPVA